MKEKPSKKAKSLRSSSADGGDVEVRLIDTDNDMNEDEEDAECLYCINRYSEDTMVRDR